MDETNEIHMMIVNGQLVSPAKRIFRYLTLQDCQSEMVLFCYILVLIASLLTIVSVVVKRTFLLTAKDIYDELCAVISKRDTDRCIKIVRKHPHLVNMFYGNSPYTPFLRACLEGNTQLVKFMILADLLVEPYLDKSLEIKFSKKSTNTSTIVVISPPYFLTLMNVLGADVHMKSVNGENAFYLATYYHIKNQNLLDATCIHALYHAGVNINEPNSKGLTPLQLATCFGHHRLVRWLLAKGANLRVTPSPYILARERGHMETVRVLCSAIDVSNGVS